MTTYKDSYLILYHGPRRGGKTLSMVFQTIVDMINGIKVFSNFKIAFEYVSKTGKRYYYESLPLDYYAFLGDAFSAQNDPQYANSTIAWDEAAFAMYSRNPMAVFNRLLGLTMILIGKWEINMYVTTQFQSMIDKNVRMQADAHIMCTDLSFKYSQLKRGSTISHIMKDFSGRFTGETFEDSGRWYQRTFYGEPFWNCYDTKDVPDAAVALRKIKTSDMDGSVHESNDYSQGEMSDLEVIRHVIGSFIADGYTATTPHTFWESVKLAKPSLTRWHGEKLLGVAGVATGLVSGHIRYYLDSQVRDENVKDRELVLVK